MRRLSLLVPAGAAVVLLVLVSASDGGTRRDGAKAIQRIVANVGQPITPLAGPQPFSVGHTGANATGRITEPGLSCAEGGAGAYRHYGIEAPLPAGSFSTLAGTVRGVVAVHHTDEATAAGDPAFLADTSLVSLGNDRGTLRFALAGGGDACTQPNLTFADRNRVAGIGALVAPVGTGAYREATITAGTYELDAALDPGADNPWSLMVNGSIDALDPGLTVEVVRAYWGNLGLDYVSRIVTVDYRITNSGLGDSYATTLDTATSPHSGVTTLGPTPQPLGDLLAAESRVVTVRYQLALLGGPCALVILGCEFPTTVTVTMPDALDAPATFAAPAAVVAPDLPPPL